MIIHPLNALIIWKKTKFELDIEKYGLEEFKKNCFIQNNSFDKIYNSHLRQLESRQFLESKVFPNATFISREDLDVLNLNSFDLMISLGGDNHFTYVSHYAYNHNIIGCNSDPKTSVGALLSCDSISLFDTVHKYNWANTNLSNWSLISAKITYPDGNEIETVKGTSEISIRNNIPDLTSRYILEYDGIKEEQKSSGILLYTGAGSTGWYQSCHGHGEASSFKKDAPYFKSFTRELSHRARKRFQLTDFEVRKELKITSMMKGGIAIDALPERIYDFPPGAIASFKLDEKKLNVITVNHR